MSAVGWLSIATTPKKEQQGFMVSDNLPPQKARLLLMLGLTITKQAVERHGGVLKIESTVGEGTRVFVRLPLVGDGEDATGSEAEVA